jgi:hypothetical protein
VGPVQGKRLCSGIRVKQKPVLIQNPGFVRGFCIRALQNIIENPCSLEACRGSIISMQIHIARSNQRFKCDAVLLCQFRIA